jgi:hypothetical protein
MSEGWFRSGHTLGRYFSATANDSFNAREIINGDKNYDPPDGVDADSMGEYIADMHKDFLSALEAALVVLPPEPEPEPELEPEVPTVRITIVATGKVEVEVNRINPLT